PHQYTFLQHLLPLNRATSWAAFALGVSQLAFVYNWFHSLFRGAKATDNPWQVGTLEWTVSSPPPHYNFDEIPTVRRGPHELSDPGFGKLLGRDWVSQSEILPDVAGSISLPESSPAAPAGAPLAAVMARREE
ncbi:MAG TPA: hypothetical protein VNN80_27920, partial [Polyangiaceae bacterium]|nr:hypothetical protein [Polyangiaceae bacterium]